MDIIKKTAIFRIVFYIAVILVFFSIPHTLVESRSICIWYNISGLICPGCGMTRALSNFMHFDIIRAGAYNPVMAFVFAPAFVFTAIQDIFIFILRLFKKTKSLSFAEFCLLLIFGGI